MPSPTPSPPPDASPLVRGLVSRVAQAFAGVKTFTQRIILQGGLELPDGYVIVGQEDLGGGNDFTGQVFIYPPAATTGLVLDSPGGANTVGFYRAGQVTNYIGTMDNAAGDPSAYPNGLLIGAWDPATTDGANWHNLIVASRDGRNMTLGAPQNTTLKVGVGVMNPTEKVEVAGNVKATKFLLADGTEVGAGGGTGVTPVEARYGLNGPTTQSIPNAVWPPTVIDFPFKRTDTDNAVTTGAGWKFTVPPGKGGVYLLSAFVNLTLPASTYFDLNLNAGVNGAAVAPLAREIGLTTANKMLAGASGSTTLTLNAGDTVDVRLYQSTDVARTVEGGQVSIVRLSNSATALAPNVPWSLSAKPASGSIYDYEGEGLVNGWVRGGTMLPEPIDLGAYFASGTTGTGRYRHSLNAQRPSWDFFQATSGSGLTAVLGRSSIALATNCVLYARFMITRLSAPGGADDALIGLCLNGPTGIIYAFANAPNNSGQHQFKLLFGENGSYSEVVLAAHIDSATRTIQQHVALLKRGNNWTMWTGDGDGGWTRLGGRDFTGGSMTGMNVMVANNHPSFNAVAGVDFVRYLPNATNLP